MDINESIYVYILPFPFRFDQHFQIVTITAKAPAIPPRSSPIVPMELLESEDVDAFDDDGGDELTLEGRAEVPEGFTETFYSVK